MSYPLGSVFIRVPGPSLKHAFNIAVALFYLIPMLHLGTGALQLLVSSMGTYLIAANVKGPNMPWIVFVYVLLFLERPMHPLTSHFLASSWVTSQSSQSMHTEGFSIRG